jgi:hypothetical protein
MAFSFDTVFKISALFTGAAAISQAQQGLQKVEQTGLLANLTLKKLAATIGGIAAGAFTIDKVTGFLNSSIDAARKAKTTYSNLGATLASLPQLQKLGSQVIKDQTKLLADLAKTMEKQGGLAASTLISTFDQLSKSGLSPAKVIDMSNAYQDMLVRVNGIKVTAEQAAASTEKWVQAVKVGGAGSGQKLVELGILTTEQIGKYESLKTANERYNYTLQEMNKHIGDTATAMKTADGVQVRFANAWNNIKVAIGTPFVAVQDKLTEAMTKIQGILVGNMDKIVTTITPVVDRLSDKFVSWIGGFIDKLPDLMPKIEKFAETFGKIFDWIIKTGPVTVPILGAISTGIGGFAVAGKVAGDVKKLGDAFGTINGVFKTLKGLNILGTIASFGVPGLIIGGIAALAFGIYELVTHWKEVSAWAVWAWQQIQKWWAPVGQWFQTNVIKPVAAAFEWMKKALALNWQEMSADAQATWNAISGVWTVVANWFTTNVITPVTDTFKSLQTALQPIWDTIANAAKTAWSGITAIWDAAASWFQINVVTPVVNTFNTLVTGLSGVWDAIKTAIGNAWDAIASAWGGGKTGGWIAENVIDPIVKLFSGLVDKLKVGNLYGAFKEWMMIVQKVETDIILRIIDLFKSLPQKIGEAMKGLGGILQRIMGAAWNQMLEKLPFGWGKQFQMNVPAEAQGPPAQKEQTEAVKQSTDALYGKSPGFIPGIQAATKQLNAFVPALQQATVASSQVGMSMGAGGGFGGGAAGGPVGAGAGAAMSLGAGGMSSSAMGVGGAFGGTKFTHYGYKKDSTPDWNSAHGIGDRNNRLVDRYSAALTLSERFARFGTRGHSTGQEFVFAGHRLRDDDTAPESDRRVDLYDPYSTASAAYGRLFSHPTLTAIGERKPELALPIESTGRSRNLLRSAASMIGMGGEGGSSPISLSMSVPITIHGVQAGREGAIAQEVKAAMQDPVRQLLEQLRKAKQHEQRLSYA